MKLIKKIRDYLLDDEFRITILKNKLNIANYDKIEYLDEEKIIIKSENTVEIKGKNLTVSKLLNQEILISGSIKEIEMR